MRNFWNKVWGGQFRLKNTVFFYSDSGSYLVIKSFFYY